MHLEEFIIKQVGKNGQVSLGKSYAGKQIQIIYLENGSLLIQPGKFVPDSEQWIYAGQNEDVLDRSIKWAENTQRQENMDVIAHRITDD